MRPLRYLLVVVLAAFLLPSHSTGQCIRAGVSAPASARPIDTDSLLAVQPRRLFDSADYSSVAATVTAASLSGGGEVFVRPGTHAISNLTIPSDVWLLGVRGLSILQCNGPGDGLVISANYAQDIRIENLVLQANNASCGKAINFSNESFGAGPVTIRDLDITSSNPNTVLWAYGLWSTFLEKANIDSLNIFQSAAIAVHMGNASNQVRLTGLDITGGSSANPAYLRGVELVNSGPEFFGGTIQGYFENSALNISGSLTVQPSFFAPDVEDSNSAPVDGASIVIDGSSNVGLYGVTGAPSLLVTGTIRGCNINGGNLGAVTFGANVIGCMVNSARASSLTDNNGQNGWMNIQAANGGQQSDKIPWAQNNPVRSD